MRAEFSRMWFDRPDGRRKHYAAVLHQQGRVWLDADWNEEVLTRMRLAELATRDAVGPCGTPDPPGTGFQIAAGADGDLKIAAGRYYADGILAELDKDTTLTGQHDLPDVGKLFLDELKKALADGESRSGLVYLEVWRRHVTHLEDPTIREVALGGPDTTTRLKTVAQVRVVPLPNALECPAAHEYLPEDGGGTLTVAQKPTAAPPGDDCRLPDESNYTGLENRLYRVEIHDPGEVPGASALAGKVLLAGDLNFISTAIVLARALTAEEAGVVNRAGAVTLGDDDQHVVVRVGRVADDGLTIPLKSVLTGNFTVAKHAYVSAPAARFKWSRDNAGFAVRVTSMSADRKTLTLESLGRDQATVLRAGDLVEVCDDASDLGPHRGHLTILADDPNPDDLTVPLDVALPPEFELERVTDSTLTSKRHLTLRRWDGSGVVGAKYETDGTTPDLDLGDGVHVQFGGHDLRAGDYWQFAARSTDGTLEALDEAPPAGVVRARCPLAVVTWTGTDAAFKVEVNKDCRTKFAPLTELVAPSANLRYVGGDGQESEPVGTLAQKLTVAVFQGRSPLEKARVRFRITAGTKGELTPPGDAPGADVEVMTDEHGIATCSWKLATQPDGRQPRPPRVQGVEATLVDPANAEPPVRFNATLGYARLGYVGGDGQESEPDGTLAQELAVVVRNGRDPLPNVTVTFTITAGTGGTLTADGTTGPSVPAKTKADGIATCVWKLDPAFAGTPAQPRRVQSVEAKLTHPPNDEPPVRFNATLGRLQFSYVGGGGQTAGRDGAPPQPLRVAVFNGYTPVEKARVGFTILNDAEGKLSGANSEPPPAAPPTTLVIPTDKNGIAACNWTLDPPRGAQTVEARLLDGANALLQPILFHAARDAGIAVKGVRVGPLPLPHGGAARPSQLKDGVFFDLDADHPKLVGFGSDTCVVSAEFPCAQLGDVFKPVQPTFLPLVLAGEVAFKEDHVIRWMPTEATVAMLKAWEDKVVESPLRVRLTLLGNFIGTASDHGPLHLDGDTFVRPDEPPTLALPSGNGQPGGDFRTWFELARPTLQPAFPVDAGGKIDLGTATPPTGTAEKTVTFKNVGPKEVLKFTVTPVSGVPDDCFSVQPASLTLDTGEDGKVVVTFLAKAAGDFNSTLRVTGSLLNSFTVPLHGVGGAGG